MWPGWTRPDLLHYPGEVQGAASLGCGFWGSSSLWRGLRPSVHPERRGSHHPNYLGLRCHVFGVLWPLYY